MPLEATMLIIDNSEYMRNGDYPPSRFEAQSDAVNTVFQTKCDSNPENTIGIMTMAGKGPEVLVTHTRDLGQVLQALHTTATSKLGGSIDIPTAIAIAQLALKHRENKNLRQRIIVFVASPPTSANGADTDGLVKLAKKLKKNNVAVDIVSFGDGIEDESTERGPLRAFVESASSGDNSHLLTVHPGAHLLSDALISSPILAADRAAGIPDELQPVDAAARGPGDAPANDFEFGVDPTLDPELAMALRMSMQEAQAREAAAAAAAGASSESATTGASTATPAAAAASSTEPGAGDDEEDALLQQAIAMSQGGESGEDVDMDDGDEEDEDEEDEDEDAAIARAIEMSMMDQDQDQDKQTSKGK